MLNKKTRKKLPVWRYTSPSGWPYFVAAVDEKQAGNVIRVYGREASFSRLEGVYATGKPREL